MRESLITKSNRQQLVSRAFCLAFAGVALSMASGCTALATGPTWTKMSLADSAPDRMAAEDARLAAETREREREPKTIRAKHILIMHDDSERKPSNIHRTKAEARKRAEEALAKIRGGTDFDAMVKQYTDEPGGAERNGDLETFEKKKMVKAFGDAAFALQVGQVSDIVETPFGFHIIKRTE